MKILTNIGLTLLHILGSAIILIEWYILLQEGLGWHALIILLGFAVLGLAYYILIRMEKKRQLYIGFIWVLLVLELIMFAPGLLFYTLVALFYYLPPAIAANKTALKALLVELIPWLSVGVIVITARIKCIGELRLNRFCTIPGKDEPNT